MDGSEQLARIREAAERQVHGQWDEAGLLYRSVLEVNPRNADALHLMGVLSLQQGEAGRAVELISAAIQIQPRVGDFHFNQAGAYYALERWEQALAAYEIALVLQPDAAGVHKGRGASLARLGRKTEAVSAYRQAIQCEPGQVPVHCELADLLVETGALQEASGVLQSALQTEPCSVEVHTRLRDLFLQQGAYRNAGMAWYNLGVAHQRAGDAAAAVEAFRASMKLHPDHPKAQYALDSLTGVTPRTAPQEYVVDLFDGYSGHFDEHLEVLQYRVPDHLHTALQSLLPEGRSVDHILDLGCGTGKCGELLRPLGKRLSGVDLSPRMIELSRARRVYDALHEGEIHAVLEQLPGPFDLVMAADLFIYVGELEWLFKLLGEKMQSGAWFAFSIETFEGEGYVLRETGRFAHSPAYLQRLAEANSFGSVFKKSLDIRLHEQVPNPGWVQVLKKR